MAMSKWVPISDPVLQRRMGKTGEECGELGAVVSRIQIQGMDEVDPGSGKTNRQRLEEEIADVYAQLDENIARLGLREEFIEQRRAVKRGYMQEWEQLFAPSNVEWRGAGTASLSHIRLGDLLGAFPYIATKNDDEGQGETKIK